MSELILLTGRRLMWPSRRVQIGFTALRDLAVLRPRVREAALDQLLALCTHAGESRSRFEPVQRELKAFVRARAIQRNPFATQRSSRSSGGSRIPNR